MKASFIIIGTELTRGIIQDSHGSLLSRELSHLGIHVSEIVIVPDDGSIEKILEALMRNSRKIRMIRNIRKAMAPAGKKKGRYWGRKDSRSTMPVKEVTYFQMARGWELPGYRYFAVQTRRK